MAMILQITLSSEDADRLFSLKAEAGRDDLTAEQYAADLLRAAIRDRHPEPVRYTDAGDVIPRRP